MDTRELRIGNLIELYGGHVVEVIKIFEKHLEVHSNVFQFWPVTLDDEEDGEASGITLTEEWLEKLNFKKVQGGVFENISLSYWVNNTICCFYNETDKDNFLLGHAYTDFLGKYHVATAYWTNEVHTLQNYYKANTRKELEVK